MLGVHLRLLQACALLSELVQQLLQHVDHTRGLKFISVCLRCCHLSLPRRFEHAHSLVQEKVKCPLGLFRDKVEMVQVPHLNKGLSLLAVIVLLLKHSNGTLQSIDRFRVVCMHLVKLNLLNLTDLGGGCDVALVNCNILLVSVDLLGKVSSSCRALCDVCLQYRNLRFCFFDGGSFLSTCVVAPLLIGSKLHLFFVLLILALGQHSFHQLNDFLHWRDRYALLYFICTGTHEGKDDR
mmetsp:Transcript_23661/g.43301  ORF Transcript_23661/g.43301 Transcript_23661/m.43301 type:complete len:238 (-) Transcript_23661:92-805(-)